MAVSPDQLARKALAEIGANGNPTFEWKLTTSYLADQVKLVVQDKTLPVIFVPGIMGSNLRDLEGKAVWRLDDGAFGVPWKLAKGIAPKGPAGRQRLMHPRRTQVDPGGKVPNKASGTVTGKDKSTRERIFRDQRFWGEVGSGSYHDYLMWLEDTLNGKGILPHMWPDFSYKNSVMSAAPTPGQSYPAASLMPGQSMIVRGMPAGANEKKMVDLTSDDLIKRAGIRMPVYACGYNWLDSNDRAAELLCDRIRYVISEESKRATCTQVLLVTHSMGGLVARRCAQLSGMRDEIAGIIHGVMPATGAAVAYRRCKIGMRDEDFGAGLVIGSNGRETTAVFAQAPGALQLLPTEQYRSGWLKIRDSDGREIHAVPKADPYSEVYLRRDRWWGLVKEEWLSPRGGVPISWEEYADNIAEARDFHALIRGFYHASTFVYYGADSGVPTYETIRWKIKQGVLPDSAAPPSVKSIPSMEFGEVRDDGTNPPYIGGKLESLPSYGGGGPAHYQSSYWELVAEQHDGAGDGTVPSSSGQSPLKHAGNSGNIRQQYRLVGFEHEPSYKNKAAQLVTLHCIHKIAAEARFPS